MEDPHHSESSDADLEALLIQTKLEQYGFMAVPRHPCWINRMLPSELIMEIFAYLPSTDNSSMVARVHAKPSDIPLHHSDYVGVDEDKEEEHDIKIMVAEDDSGYGDCIAQALFPEGCAQYCSSGPWNYLDVLRVCRFWHSSAELSPQFWTHLPSQSLTTIKRSLKLSGALPLFAIADDDHTWPSELAFTTVLQHLPRISVLDITYATKRCKSGEEQLESLWNIDAVLKSFANLHAPMLRVLKLLHWIDKRLNTNQWIEQSFPSLEVLQLGCLEISSPCALLVPTLTELDLFQCTAPWTTSEQLLLCLVNMPQLRKLQLQETPLPIDLDSDVCPSTIGLMDPIPLAHLRRLGIDGSFRSVNRLLSRLSIPPGKTSLELTFEGRYRPGDYADRRKTHNLISSFPAWMPPGTYFTSVHLFLQFDRRYVDVTISEPRNPTGAPCANAIQLQMHWDEDEDADAPQMMDFLLGMTETLLRNSRQTRLTYSQSGLYPGSRHTRLGPDLYLSCLEELTDVAAVRLSNREGAGAFIQWMMSECRRGVVPFPAPQRLTLHDVDLRKEVSNRASRAHLDHILYAQLWVYLHYHQPRSLHLNSVKASPRMLAELTRLVPFLDARDTRRVQERERFKVDRTCFDTRELLQIYSASKNKEWRALLRVVEAPRTGMLWERERAVVKDAEDTSSQSGTWT